jgi:hypothetical protein
MQQCAILWHADSRHGQLSVLTTLQVPHSTSFLDAAHNKTETLYVWWAWLLGLVVTASSRAGKLGLVRLMRVPKSGKGCAR